MRAVRHTARARARAIELRAAGWSLARVAALLADEGVVVSPPSKRTIRRWTEPATEEKDREHARDRQRRTPHTYRWPGARSAIWLHGRIRALTDAGVGASAIARVMAHDFPGLHLTARQVEHAARSDEPTLPLRRAAEDWGMAA